MKLAVDPTQVPPPSAFTLYYPVIDAPQTTHRVYRDNNIDRVSIERTKVHLHLNLPVYPCDGAEPLRVGYTQPTNDNLKLRGFNLSRAANWGATHKDNPVANARDQHCAAWLAGAWNGSVILEALRPFARDRGEPDTGWFAVTALGGPVTVTGAAFSPDDGNRLKLTLDRDFAPSETVTVSYRRPRGVRGLWDVDGNQLEDVANAPVKNESAAATAPAFDDGAAVTLTIAENHADGAVVGTVAATDADGDTLTYSLSGDDAERYSVTASRSGFRP